MTTFFSIEDKMEVEKQENIAELPYRASINPDAYEKCGQAYFHYFEELERLGPLDTSKMSSAARNYAGKKVKVGAKPLSGVRGIYYTRGTWRVQYRGTDGEIVSCVFNYDSKDVLIATFDLAFRLLRKVINLGRQVKSEDGMIITELTEERLLDLDRRSKMRKNKQDSTVTKDLLAVSSKRISRPRHDRLLAKGEDDIDSESDQIYTQVRKKTRPRTGDIAYNANVMTYQAPMPYVTASGNTMIPNTGCYPGKMDSFERMFHSYGNFTTHQLISYLIDKKCMRNKDRAPSVQRGGCQMGGEIQSTSGGEYGNEIYNPYDHELHSNEHSFNKDINGITNSGRLYRDDTNDIFYMAEPKFIHNKHPDVCNASTGLPCECDNMTDYDPEQAVHSSSLEGEEGSMDKMDDTFDEAGSKPSESKIQLVKQNNNEDGSTYCGYRQGYIHM